MQCKMQNEFKFFNNKKGFNDITIVAVIVFILLGTAVIIPFINSAFNQNIDNFDRDNFEGNVKSDAENVSSFNAFQVLLTLLKLAFFDFGNSLGLPFWLDAIYTGLAIILILAVARNIWIGGGG